MFWRTARFGEVAGAMAVVHEQPDHVKNATNYSTVATADKWRGAGARQVASKPGAGRTGCAGRGAVDHDPALPLDAVQSEHLEQHRHRHSTVTAPSQHRPRRSHSTGHRLNHSYITGTAQSPGPASPRPAPSRPRPECGNRWMGGPRQSQSGMTSDCRHRSAPDSMGIK